MPRVPFVRLALLLAMLAFPVPAGALAPVEAPPGPARQRVLSVGGSAGEPVLGLTVKMLTSHELQDAWEAGFGWSQVADDGWEFHAQRQWHLKELHKSPRGVFTWYLGAGGRVKQADGTRFGVRGSTGLNYVFPAVERRWEAFFEVAPIVDITPDVHTFGSASVGLRYFLPTPTR
ncbi:MAG TPA: hypothetical protein VGS03_15015 [Candidatus Polarisedimenticolia bacterium]|jgi:hypothetical protein|nr:hypothetical protein [Candidatus Polarisedimenticolia bacterium]